MGACRMDCEPVARHFQNSSSCHIEAESEGTRPSVQGKDHSSLEPSTGQAISTCGRPLGEQDLRGIEALSKADGKIEIPEETLWGANGHFPPLTDGNLRN